MGEMIRVRQEHGGSVLLVVEVEPSQVSNYGVFDVEMRLPSFSGHPICTDLVSVGEDVHCESTAQEVHAGVPA